MSQREELLAVLRKLGMEPEEDADGLNVYLRLEQLSMLHPVDGKYYAEFSFDQEDDFTGVSVETF